MSTIELQPQAQNAMAAQPAAQDHSCDRPATDLESNKPRLSMRGGGLLCMSFQIAPTTALAWCSELSLLTITRR